MMATRPLIQPSARSSRPGKLVISPISGASSPASIASPSSGVPTPTTTAHILAMKPSAGSPQPLASMATTPLSQGQMPKNSITSREWVVPPRPKPGRKPATDTPPTKRKAQNRAAQRAFRERRAARVGELEEQLDEVREEHERIEQELQDRVQCLDGEVQNLRSRCGILEDMLERERDQNHIISSELDALRRQQREEGPGGQSRHGSLSHLPTKAHTLSNSSLHPTPRRSIASRSENRNSAISIAQIISHPDPSADDHAMTDIGCGSCDPNGSCACVDEVLANTNHGPSTDCGKCSLGTKCECFEAAIGRSLTSHSESDLKRRPPCNSAMGPEEKRHKSISNSNENEIDFTAMFSRKRQPVVVESAPAIYQPLPQPIPMTIPPRDSCGFCQDGTYCMCAEAAAAAASQSTLPPMGNQSQVQTPPPSEDDVMPLSAPAPAPYEITATGAVKLPSLFDRDRQNPKAVNIAPISEPSKANGCGPKGPGSCAQCLSDPKSGLFCRSLAAKLQRQGKPDGCCGGSGGGGCCKSGNTTPNPASSSRDSPGVSLSCADAYKTLASHRNFDKAADDIGTWLPRLRAVPMEIEDTGRDDIRHGPRPIGRGSGVRGRCPIEVETASIMSVLKGFDVRFGREG